MNRQEIIKMIINDLSSVNELIKKYEKILDQITIRCDRCGDDCVYIINRELIKKKNKHE